MHQEWTGTRVYVGLTAARGRRVCGHPCPASTTWVKRSCGPQMCGEGRRIQSPGQDTELRKRSVNHMAKWLSTAQCKLTTESKKRVSPSMVLATAS